MELDENEFTIIEVRLIDVKINSVENKKNYTSIKLIIHLALTRKAWK